MVYKQFRFWKRTGLDLRDDLEKRFSASSTFSPLARSFLSVGFFCAVCVSCVKRNMGSTNADVKKVLAGQPGQDEENNDSSNVPDPAQEKQSESEFDTGLTTWLQVLGSFFLFFNSWYDSNHSIVQCQANSNATGASSIHGAHIKLITSKNCSWAFHHRLLPGLAHCSLSF